MISVGYQETDWALERQFVGALRQNPRIGLVNIDNARPGRDRHIRSAFLERYLTDPEPFLFSTGTGRPVRRWNDVVVAMSTNFGMISEDLMNRALPIRLAQVGDVSHRSSPIGNPKLEYLPAHREPIAAELRGMVERWRREGNLWTGATTTRSPSACKRSGESCSSTATATSWGTSGPAGRLTTRCAWASDCSGRRGRGNT